MSKNFPTDKDIIIDDLDGQYVLNLTDEEHGRLRKMTAADLFLVTMIVARAVKSRLALPDDDDSEVTALTVKVGEMEREQARIVEAHRNVILNLTNAIEAEEVVHRDVILNLTNGIEAELKERDAEVARLRACARMGWETARCLAIELSAGTGRESASERAANAALDALEAEDRSPSHRQQRGEEDMKCEHCGIEKFSPGMASNINYHTDAMCRDVLKARCAELRDCFARLNWRCELELGKARAEVARLREALAQALADDAEKKT